MADKENTRNYTKDILGNIKNASQNKQRNRALINVHYQLEKIISKLEKHEQ